MTDGRITGKHRLSSDVAVPLRAVCLPGRGEDNGIGRVPVAEPYPALLQRMYRSLSVLIELSGEGRVIAVEPLALAYPVSSSPRLLIFTRAVPPL